ncbi:MAG: AhpC/TSA family protein [Alistipes sp.]|nr:AhpC/TSA family protein [Alistipes sp.]MBQ1940213.1 AhpC/TSA family protein [Alistipes sp.]MBQ2392781.1 AhpC/TSA family protein [Alistipes sp.]MBQ5393599.1 AhpC/TSA family protein [Alistipes sp.]MBQ5638129.1 AhpC/TSA family protein [Alistipes sp.]
MKKMMFGVLAMAALVGCSTQPKFTVSGQVEDVEKMYLVERVDGAFVAIDSVEVVEGKFELSGCASEAKMLYVSNLKEVRGAAVVARFFVEEGAITLTKTEDGYVASGTPANDAVVAYVEAIAPLRAEYREAAPERREEIEAAYEAAQQEALEQNKDNLFGVQMLQNLAYELSGTALKEAIASFSPEMQAAAMMQPIAEMAEKKIKTEVGQPYIDFTQPDAEGNGVTLKSVIENPANKYVLVDFWASWCSPCMAEVPALKAAYDEFHKKGFEIFGVSLDNRKEAWEAAIKNKELNWLHVSDLKGWENAAAAEYGVKSIPSNYLVDCATGQIVGVNLRGEAVAEKVAEFLK